MTPQEITKRLLVQHEQPDFDHLIKELRPHLTIDLIAYLKKRVDKEKLKDAHLALRIATLAESLVPYISQPEAEALAHWTKGTALLHLSGYQEALVYCHSAAAIYEAQGQLLPWVGVQSSIVAALRNLGDHQAIFALAPEVRARAKTLGAPAQPYLGSLEMNLGAIYRQLGDLEAALEAYERGRAIFAQLGDAIEVARIDSNRSNVLQDMSRFIAAQELLLDARQTLTQADQLGQQVAYVDLNLGVLAYRRGRYEEALTHFEAARQGFAGIDTWIAMVDLRRCLIYRKLNLIEETMNLAATVEPIFAQKGMLVQQGLALYLLGAAYQLSSAFKQAEYYLTKARNVLLEQGVRAILFEVDYDLAHLAYLSGRIDDAQQLAQQLLMTIAADTWPLLAAQTRLLLAQCALIKQPESARDHAQAALELSITYLLHEITIAAHHLMGQILEKRASAQLAWSEYQKAMQKIESLRVNLLVDEFRIGFMENKQPIYADAVRLSQQIATPAQLLSLLNLAHTAPLPRFSSALPTEHPLQRELVGLREEWHWYQNKLEEAQHDEDAAAITASRRQIEAKLADLSHRWHSYQASVPSTPPIAARERWRSEAAEQFLSHIQQNLQQNECLLHYYLINDTFQALLVKKDAIHIQPNLSPAKPLVRVLRGWSRHLSQINLISQSPLTAKSLAQRYLHRLYQALIAPLSADLENINHLFVVMPPDWHNLPLAAFFDGQHYLTERYQISYLSAPEVLTDTRTPLESPTRALMIGHSNEGEYPGILYATHTIKQNFPAGWSSTLLMDADATFEKFKQASRESNLIHLATHATFRVDNPLFSWARLAGHRLTVAELYQMKLPHNPLVVFSACETGLGKPRGGGLLGMGRALLAAGASGLVVTLWRVEDQATAHLMVDFYAQLARYEQITHVASAALHQAQQQAIAKEQHPFFWAGFIFIQG